MDRTLAAAAQALSHGDPLTALKHVALRQDARALALRGTALAQLGEYARARTLFKRAEKSFRDDHALARARCHVALAEIDLATRELPEAERGLAHAIDVLTRSGDLLNASHARLLHARIALARGDVMGARERLHAIEAHEAAHALRALHALTQAEVALRSMQPDAARRALTAAARAAMRAQIPALIAEVRAAASTAARPVARLITPAGAELLSLAHVAMLLKGPALVVDGCRRRVQQGAVAIDYATRPVLFALIRQLAAAHPEEVSREALIRAAFGMQRVNDSLRARLRVAVGRVRKQLADMAEIRASTTGFVLVPRAAPVRLLLPPRDDDASALLALISDGQAWSTSALSLALGESQRSVQRALAALQRTGRVQSLGRGKGRRWVAATLHPFAPHMLLSVASPGR